MSTFQFSPRVVALGAGMTLVAGALFATGMVNHQQEAQAAVGATDTVPVNRTQEASSGIRVLSAHVIGDGGIVDLRYQVLDSTKAGVVEGDVNHTPTLTDVDSGSALQDTAAMRHGHSMQNGGTYFLLYYNKSGVVKPGDLINVTINGITLNNVPVE